jgi:CheY-like chemotaxis protein
VLVVEGKAEDRRRIAALLGEAGIRVTAVADGAAALVALSSERFELAVVGASARFDGAGLGLAVVPFDRGEPRRSIGRVREGLLGAEFAEADEAERWITAAKIACLEQRQHAAYRDGATDLAASLAREIAETTALGALRH